jgi:triacylglycerol lipase
VEGKLLVELRFVDRHELQDTLFTAAQVADMLKLDGAWYVAGHSLGGALAVVAADRFFGTDQREALLSAVYTFGMPRPGNASFKSRYDKRFGIRTFRFVYGADVVTTVAPPVPPFDFQHVGIEVRAAAGHRFTAIDQTSVHPDAPPTHTETIAQHLRDLVHRPFRSAPDLPPFPRSDFVGDLADALPPAIRDHLPDRYLWALDALP